MSKLRRHAKRTLFVGTPLVAAWKIALLLFGLSVSIQPITQYAERLSYSAEQPPRFAVQAVDSLWGGRLTSLKAEIIGRDGAYRRPVALEPQSDGRYVLPAQALSDLAPGSYELAVTAHGSNGRSSSARQRFNWGVLATNADKDSYVAGEAIGVGVAVLSRTGETVCDAKVTVRLVRRWWPDQVVSAGRSSSCADKNITNAPDYSARLNAPGPGRFEVRVIAESAHGRHEAVRTLEVLAKAPQYSVQREATPTRIFPRSQYGATAHIALSEAFRGALIEEVPSGFVVSQPKIVAKTPDGAEREVKARFSTLTENGRQKLRWDGVLAEQGERLSLSYRFQAPLVSPELYRLGGLSLQNESGTQLYREPYRWEIASDAINQIIVMWDPANGAVPAGWTCISCSSGQPMYQRFPYMVSAISGTPSAGGPETTSHTYTQSAVSAPVEPVAVPQVSTLFGNVSVAPGTHSHSGFATTTTGNADIKPPYKQLMFIQATNPTTLPLNSIAMFDNAANIPAGWAAYNALNDPDATGTTGNGVYVRGEGAAGSCSRAACSTHTHTRGAIGPSGAATGTAVSAASGAVAIGTNTHTHSIVAGSTPSDNNDPVYATVIFAQAAGGSLTIPNNMLALLDSATMPIGWSLLSTAGSQYQNRLLKGDRTTAASTGGVTTRNHGGTQILATGAPSATGNASTTLGTTAASSSAHTHNVTFTISSANAVPNYREVLLGKYRTIVISGRVYSDEGVTAVTSQPTVTVAVAGQTQITTTAAANGTYSVEVPDPGAGANITAWVSGALTGAVSTTGNASAISGLDIYQNRLIVRHEDAGPATASTVGVCDKTTGTACSSANLHFDDSAGGFTVDNDWSLYIWGAKTFAPGKQLTLASGGAASTAGGDLAWAAASSTLTMGANTLTIGGDWRNSAGGTFTRDTTQTTVMAATGTGYSIANGGQSFSNLTFNGAGGAWSFATTNQTVANDLTLSAGTVTAPSGTLSVGGSYLNNANFTHNSGTVAFTATTTGKTLAGTLSGASQFNALQFTGAAGGWSINATLATVGAMQANAGTVSTDQNITVGSTLTGNGSLSATAGTVSVLGSGSFGGTSAWSFSTLSFGSGAIGSASASGGGGIAVTNILQLATGYTLNAGSKTWTLAGNTGTPLQLSGSATVAADTSTFSYTGDNASGLTTLGNITYYKLNVNRAGETFVPAGVLSILSDLAVPAGTLALGSSSMTVGSTAVTNSGGIVVGGSLTQSSGTVTVRSSAAGTATVGGGTFSINQLTVEGGSSAATFTLGTGASQTLQLAAGLTVGDAARSAVVSAATNNVALDVNGGVTILAGSTLVAPTTAAFTVGGGWLNAGSLTHSNGTITFDGAGTANTVEAGGTGSGKAFYNLAFNNASGGWTVQSGDLLTANNLALTALTAFTVQSGRSLEVRGAYSHCTTCPAGTTWTGATLFLNSGTNYTVGTKTQTTEQYGTLSIGVNTDVRLWQSSAVTIAVDGSGSLYSQDSGAVDGALLIYGDYHSTGADYWRYDTDFDGAALAGAAQRQAAVQIETGASRGVTVDVTGSLAVAGGGGGSNQATTVQRIGASGTYRLVNASGVVTASDSAISNVQFAGGPWTALNTTLNAFSVTAGTLNVDWYLGMHYVDRDSTSTNIATAANAVAVVETGGAATVFKGTGSGWSAGASSQTTATSATGRLPAPAATGAIRLRELSNAAGSATYYAYNLTVAAEGIYTDYSFTRDYGGLAITSTASGATSGVAKVIGSSWFRPVSATDNPDTATVNGAPNTGTWYTGPAKAIMLLWDGTQASIPSGWSCVSCTAGDTYYQKFLRAVSGSSALASGGADTNGHHLTFVSAANGASVSAAATGTNFNTAVHGHSWAFPAGSNTTAADIKPPYRSLLVIKGPSTGVWPAGVIAPYRAAATSPPSGWTNYSATMGDTYLRGDGAVSTGGAATHTHTTNALTSSTSGNVVSISTSTLGGSTTAATSAHTHSVPATAFGTGDANDPSYVTTAFIKASSAQSAPSNVLGLFAHTTTPGGWSVISNGASYDGKLIKAATSPDATGGTATRNHGGSFNVTSGAASASATVGTLLASTAIAATSHTHALSYTIDPASTFPAYADVVLMQFAGSVNQNPNAPSALTQKRTSTGVAIPTGGWVNGTDITFEAQLSDADASDSLQLCVEVKAMPAAFDGSGEQCGTAVSYVGVPLVGSVAATMGDAAEYRWRARVKDAAGTYSAYVSYGSGSRDFGVDTTAPTGGQVYDGTVSGVDQDQNGDGSLSQLSANWAGVDAAASGLAAYEYSIGTSAGATDVRAWTAVGTATSVTDSTLVLTTAGVYYFNLRVTDNAGNSTIFSSNGQVVTPTLQISVAPSNQTFDALNASNDRSGTQATTLTTSTNAANGYGIYARRGAAFMLEGGAATIADFAGGTYASPAAWPAGQCSGSSCGYGYTSSDTTINGVDKYGGATLYAPYPGSGGDLVADHTDAVSGAPVSGESFTITSKVSVSPAQAGGSYSTSLIFTIIPRY